MILKRLLTLILFAALVLFADSASVAQNFWEQAGGPLNGYIGFLGIGANGTVFAASNGQQIFRSTDKGLSWILCDTGILLRGSPTTPTINAFVSTTAGQVIAGTGPAELRGTNGLSSADDGRSWGQFDQTLGQLVFDFRSIAIAPNGSIFAAVWVHAGGPSALFTNGGTGWMDAGIPDMVLSIAAAPNGFIYAASLDSGLYRSTDNGKHWKITSMPGHLTNSVSVTSTGEVFATVIDGTQPATYQSKDNGTTWVKIGENLKLPGAFFSGTNGVLFARGSTEIYRSDDNAATWYSISSGITDSELTALTVCPTGELIVATQNRGLFRSTDKGGTWMPSTIGITNIAATGLASGAPGHLVAATVVGAYYSNDNAASWVAPVSETRLKWVSRGPSGHIYIDSYRSTDAGKSWSRMALQGIYSVSCAMGEGCAVAGNGDLLINASNPMIDPSNCGLIGIWRSTDEGDSWQQQDTAVHSSFNPSFNVLAVSPNYTLFGGGNSGTSACYRSTDTGRSWTDVGNTGQNNGPSWDISCIAFNSKGDVFVAASPFYGGLYRSTNNGDSWTNPSHGIKSDNNTSPISLIVSPEDVLFISTDSGVFRSMDNGDNWEQLSSGLTASRIGPIEIGADGTLYVSTERGIFRSTRSALGVSTNTEIPKQTLSQNSPNPVTQSTTISFTLPEPSYITLTLYDATGREVAALANGFMDAGEHDVPFQRGNTPSGVYFYRLESGGQSQTRAMVVLP